MHLIPSLMNLQSLNSSHLLRFLLSVESPVLQSERMARRCESTYLNRHHAKYEPHEDAFEVLRNHLTEEAQKASIVSINNNKASETLKQIMHLIDQSISNNLKSHLKTGVL